MHVRSLFLILALIAGLLMAAPTLQAEGSLTVVTTGALAPSIPTHEVNDILVVAWGFWGPNSTSLPDAAVPSGWTQAGVQLSFGTGNIDGKIGYFWKRAPAAGQTISIARPSGWDTGTDTAWGGRAYVIRGCITTGDPWDEADLTALYTTANQPVDALTVLGTERLAIHFLAKCDDFVTAPTVSGWTAGTQLESTTGTDHSQGSFRKDNVSADTGADASTVEAPAPTGNGYAFLGVSFKPPDAGPTVIDAIESLLVAATETVIGAATFDRAESLRVDDLEGVLGLALFDRTETLALLASEQAEGVPALTDTDSLKAVLVDVTDAVDIRLAPVESAPVTASEIVDALLASLFPAETLGIAASEVPDSGSIRIDPAEGSAVGLADAADALDVRLDDGEALPITINSEVESALVLVSAFDILGIEAGSAGEAQPEDGGSLGVRHVVRLSWPNQSESTGGPP